MYLRPACCLLIVLIFAFFAACVDAYEPEFNATVDVIVVDGTITNLAEAQVVRLSRSKADPLTGRFGTMPVTKAAVEVLVDESRSYALHETMPGSYQLPSDFRGHVGHTYRLRFTLDNGARYESSPEMMPAVPPIDRVQVRFNPQSLPPAQPGVYTAGHDIFIDTNDPADQTNFYRWDWALYERQEWCRSCRQSVYAVNNILPNTYRFRTYFVSGDQPFEDCFIPPYDPSPEAPHVNKSDWVFDYNCRTACWEIIRNYNFNLFRDQFSNGGKVVSRKVAQIPFYQRQGCLVEIRQLSLTSAAFTYFQRLSDQTENTGGLADTPPAAPIGNVRNVANGREAVVGYFSASAVSKISHWIDRKDATGVPLGATDPDGASPLQGSELFYAIYKRRPNPEPSPPYTGERQMPPILIWGGPLRVPTAVCVYSDSRTPFRPEGWRDE